MCEKCIDKLATALDWVNEPDTQDEQVDRATCVFNTLQIGLALTAHHIDKLPEHARAEVNSLIDALGLREQVNAQLALAGVEEVTHAVH